MGLNSCWVACYTCKTMSITYLQTHITRNFLCQNQEKNVYIYLQFSIIHARYARLISLKTIQVNVKNVRNFCCLFQIFNFISFLDIRYTNCWVIKKKSKMSPVWIYLMVATFYRLFYKFDKSQFWIVCISSYFCFQFFL